MSEKTQDVTGEGRIQPIPIAPQDEERYPIVELETGESLLFDRNEQAAWIKSNVTINLAEVE